MAEACTKGSRRFKRARFGTVAVTWAEFPRHKPPPLRRMRRLSSDPPWIEFSHRTPLALEHRDLLPEREDLQGRVGVSAEENANCCQHCER